MKTMADNRDDAEAWTQTLSALEFVTGPYRFNTSIKEIVPLASNDFAIWQRPCGSIYREVDDANAENFEDCSHYPNWTDLNSVRGDNSVLRLEGVLSSLPSISANPKFDDVPKADTLLVLTVSNELSTTLATLSSIREAASANNADICIIDDASVDGTAAYLRKLGYYVLSRSASAGLTKSWNVAYEIATRHRYKYLFIMNNDIILCS